MAPTHSLTRPMVEQWRWQRLAHPEQEALATLVARLVQRFGDDLHRVVLFGSKARGDDDYESDLDLLVVLRMTPEEHRLRWNEVVDIAWEIELAYSVVTSLVVKDESAYAVMQREGMLLARNIERDGIVLWTTPANVPLSRPA